ncbi:MAG: hypothetical protein IKG69_09845 [Atopobiaceae bacterium]|nr:hypothetical protein [Atopobiaceae bacterium]
MADLERRFAYHPPKEGQPEAYGEIRLHARLMAELVDDLCHDGREKSIALTRIEEAVMWANAAIARGGE